jgi:hypothetical protein
MEKINIELNRKASEAQLAPIFNESLNPVVHLSSAPVTTTLYAPEDVLMKFADEIDPDPTDLEKQAVLSVPHHRHYSLDDKLAALQNPFGSNIPSSTISQWSHHPQSLQPLTKKRQREKGGGRHSKLSDVQEYELSERLMNVRKEGKRVTSKLIRRLAMDMKVPDFKASEGWMQNFCRRQGITIHHINKFHSKKEISEVMDCIQLFWARMSSYRFPLERVFNIDETHISFESRYPYTYDKKGHHTEMSAESFGMMKGGASVVLGVSGCGKKLPPGILFSGKNQLNVNQTGPINCWIHFCESG